MAWRKKPPKHLFMLGQIAMTPAALDLMVKHQILAGELLEMHVTRNPLNNEGITMTGLGENVDGTAWSTFRFDLDNVEVITKADRSETLIRVPADKPLEEPA